MGRIWEWLKAHPYLAGGSVLGFFVLIMLMRRGSGSAGSSGAAAVGSGYYGPSEGLQAAALSTGAQLQGLAYQAQTEISGFQAQENIARIQADGAIMDRWFQSQVDRDGIAASLKLGLVQTSAQLAALDRTAMYSEDGGMSIVFGATEASRRDNLRISLAPTIAQAINSTPAAQTVIYGGGGGTQPAGARVAITDVPDPRAGQSYDAFLGAAYVDAMNHGIAIANPNIGFPDPNAVANREAVSAQAQTEWITGRNSPHNVAPGDWYDAAGRLQSCGSMPGDARCA